MIKLSMSDNNKHGTLTRDSCKHTNLCDTKKSQ